MRPVYDNTAPKKATNLSINSDLLRKARELAPSRKIGRPATRLLRRAPRSPYTWDGVAEVRPFGAMEKTIVEGVY